jgi:hypothetical protein
MEESARRKVSSPIALSIPVVTVRTFKSRQRTGGGEYPEIEEIEG